MFSCEICEIFKNTFFEEHLRTAASERKNLKKTIYSRSNVVKKFFGYFLRLSTPPDKQTNEIGRMKLDANKK